MSRVDTAGPDRLPWLPDEPSQPAARSRSGAALPFAAAGVLLLAGGIFWLGVRSLSSERHPGQQRGAASTTVRLPAAKPVAPQISIVPQPQVRPVAAPEVRPAPVHEVRILAPRAPKFRGATAQRESVEEKDKAPAPAVSEPSSTPEFVMPKPWNPRIFKGASGRVVQIGAFGTTHQAKRGWWFMVRAYPGVARLPAVVRTSRNSKGRTFYRFQVGTTSQAHSEILCQRMERIGLSCAVVGLPWKARVER